MCATHDKDKRGIRKTNCKSSQRWYDNTIIGLKETVCAEEVSIHVP
jgi:hypothetical protein